MRRYYHFLSPLAVSRQNTLRDNRNVTMVLPRRTVSLVSELMMNLSRGILYLVSQTVQAPDICDIYEK